MLCRSCVVVVFLAFQGKGENCSPEAVARRIQEGHRQMRAGEYVKADHGFAELLACQRQMQPASDLEVAVTLTNMGESKRRQHNFKAAEALLKQSGLLLENAGLTEHLAFGGVQLSLATIYKDRKQYARAEPLVRNAMRIFDRSPGPDSSVAAAALNTLAVLHAESGDLEGAERHLRKALQRRQDSPPDNSNATIQHNLGKLLFLQGHVSEAEEWLRKALELRSQLLGNRHADTRRTLDVYERLLKSTGRKAEARQIRARMALTNTGRP